MTIDFKKELDRGLRSIEGNNCEQALEILEPLLQHAPTELEYAILAKNVGHCYLHLLNPSKAEPILVNAFKVGVMLSQEDQRAADLLEIGWGLVRCQVSLSDSIRAYESILSCDKILHTFSGKEWAMSRYYYFSVKAIFFRWQKKYKEAMKLFKEAKREIRNFDSRVNRRRYLAVMTYQMGLTHVFWGHPRRGARLFSKVNLELLRDDLHNMYVTSWIIAENRKKNHNQVLVLYKKYQTIADASTQKDFVDYALGEAYFWLGYPNRAKVYFEEVLKKTSEDLLTSQSEKYLESIARAEPDAK